MKRLIKSNAAGIINETVLQHYGIELSERRDIANIDERTAYAIKQAMVHVLQMRYPKAEAQKVNQFVSCIIRYIMHMEPEIVLKLTENEPLLCTWGRVVDGIRRSLIKTHAGSEMSNDKVIVTIVPELLKELERTYF